MNLVHGSLFSGLDAPSVAASWLGWKNAFHCEINPFCNVILNYWFPESEHYEDITKTDFRKWRERIDVLTGGFPCQPFSVAGQRKGADDNRYLWPEFKRAIREIQPAWVVGENVGGIITMVQPGDEVEVGSQTSLFGEDNRKRVLLRQQYVVETICCDLEREGYSVWPLVIPACAVGAPHRRDRVWFVAYRNSAGLQEERPEQQAARASGICTQSVAHRSDTRVEEVQREWEDGILSGGIVADTDIHRCRIGENKQEPVAQCEGTPDDSTDGENGTSAHADSQRHSSCRTSEKIERIGSKFYGEQKEREQSPEWVDGLHGFLQSASNSQCQRSRQILEEIQPKKPDRDSFNGNGDEQLTPYSTSQQSERMRSRQSEYSIQEQGKLGGSGVESHYNIWGGDRSEEKWRNFPTQPPVCRGNDGLPFDVDRLTLPFSRWRQESVKGFGNAIVPQVILEIFKAIEAAEEHFNKRK